MSKYEFDESTLEKLDQLRQKLSDRGENLDGHLDALIHSKFLNYWDYLRIEELLSLQHPQSEYEDEFVFIVYHQITELYFRLIIHEYDQIVYKPFSIGHFKEKMTRIDRYFDKLVHAFDILIEGMERDQFLSMRKALLPASGFQSAQYRYLQFYATDLINLVAFDRREALKNSSIESQFEEVYWRRGATNMETGKKTSTLVDFEKKYDGEFLEFCRKIRHHNISRIIDENFNEVTSDEDLVKTLRNFDVQANILWPDAHLKAVSTHMEGPGKMPSTGKTNYGKFLSASFQKIIFFPSLWTKEEKTNWGGKYFYEELAS